MKALIFNSSPRKDGNTALICRTMEKLLGERFQDLTVTTYRLHTLSVAPCNGCNTCKRNGGTCVINDDGKMLCDQIKEADILIFATPVYQSGVSAQMKLLLDRSYSIGGLTPVKKQIAYVVTDGVDALDVEHYSLIHRQFALLSPYEGWELKGYCAFSVTERDVLSDPADVERQLAAMLDA